MPDLNYNENECARCGGTFHMELSRCPHCGVNLYEPEEERQTEISAVENVKNVLRLPFAILIGWIISAFISLLLYIPIRLASAETPTTVFITLLATVTLSLGAFAGGFLCQRIHQSKSQLGTFSQVGFSVLLGVLVFLTEGSLWTVLSIIGVLIIGVASFFGGKVADKMLRQAMINDLFAPVMESQKRYQELLAKVGNDREVAERLIEHEHSITPKATRNILIENAIKRWKRDNRI